MLAGGYDLSVYFIDFVAADGILFDIYDLTLVPDSWVFLCILEFTYA